MSDNVKNFFEGYAQAKAENLWGYIDKTGNWVINAQYLNAEKFNNGVARIRTTVNGVKYWGIIDKKGGYVAEAKFKKIRSLNASGLYSFFN